MRKELQQGDVWIEASAVPRYANAVPIRPLAYGEVTGHAHRLAVADDVEVEMFECDGRTWLRASGPVELVHEEHKAVLIPAGEFEYGKIHEYDYDAHEARLVRD